MIENVPAQVLAAETELKNAIHTLSVMRANGDADPEQVADYKKFIQFCQGILDDADAKLAIH